MVTELQWLEWKESYGTDAAWHHDPTRLLWALTLLADGADNAKIIFASVDISGSQGVKCLLLQYPLGDKPLGV